MYVGGLWRAVEICSTLAETNNFAVSTSAAPTDRAPTTASADTINASGSSDTGNMKIKNPRSIKSRFGKSSRNTTATKGSAAIRIQTFRPSSSGFRLPFGLGSLTGSLTGVLTALVTGDTDYYSSGIQSTTSLYGSGSSGSNGPTSVSDSNHALYMCDDVIGSTGMASSDSLGVGQALSSVGGGPLLSYLIKHSPVAAKALLEKIFTNSLD